jgi:type IV pilus assembly protein PilB
VRVYEQAAGSVRVGQALVRLGHASEQQVLEALEEQRRTGERLGEILVSRGVITRRQLYEALAYSLGVPFVDIANSPPDPESIRANVLTGTPRV